MSARDDEPTRLGGEAQRLVDAARPLPRLSPAHKAHLRGRVMAAVAAGGAVGASGAAAKAAVESASLDAGAGGGAGLGGGSGTAAELVSGAVVKSAGVSLLTKVAVVVGMATLGASAFLWSKAHEHVPRPLTPAAAVSAFLEDDSDSSGATAAPAATEEASSTGTVEAPSFADPVAAANASAGRAEMGASAPGARAGAPSASGTPSSEPEAVDPLQEETRLIAAAHSALSSGDAAGALVLLDRHAAKFPRGTMAPERRAARAMALCKLGRTSEGRREAEALFGKDSKSPMAAKIDRACGK